MNSDLKNKKLIIFDLDGTLAESKSPMDEEMIELLTKLLEKKKVAIMSGGSFHQFQKQFLGDFPHSDFLKNLYLCPTCGSSFYQYDMAWKEVYSEKLTSEEKRRIYEAFDIALEKVGFQKPEKMYGELIEDRGSQITFSAFGQQAPLSLKAPWDPDHVKRLAMISFLEKSLPDLEARIGGTTSIDVTKKSIDKAYGVRKLQENLHIPIAEMLFVGDALFPGGNDYSATVTGIDTAPVLGPEDTKALIRRLIS
jgi:phosphomannomutase